MRPLVLVVCGLLVAGCLPEPATTEARSINGLYQIVLALGIVVALLVWGLLTLAILRFRRRRHIDDDAEAIPPQIGGHIGLEAVWTFVPLLTIFGIFGLTLVTLNDVERSDGAAPVELHVEAFQWGWRMSYPAEGVSVEGFREPGPEAIVPVGEPLLITLTSVDVIHSFYVPQFLYKRDAVPGHPHTFELTVEQPGSFMGQCAEYCGLLHARMPFTIRAVDRGEFGAWLVAQRAAHGAPELPPAASASPP